MDNEDLNKTPEVETAETETEGGQIEYIIQDTDKPMDLFTRLISIFVSPVKLMENINKFPRMAPPLIIFIIAGIITAVMYPSYMDIYAHEQSLVLIERYGADYANISELMQTEGVEAITNATVLITAMVTPYISGFFAAVILMLLCFVAGCKPKFAQFYSMHIHAMAIAAVLGVVSMYFMIVTKTSVNVLALGGFIMPNGNYLNPVYEALNVISVVNIWQMVLIIIGLKAITGASGTKAFVIAVTSFVFLIAFTGASTFLTTMALDFTYGAMSSVSF